MQIFKIFSLVCILMLVYLQNAECKAVTAVVNQQQQQQFGVNSQQRPWAATKKQGTTQACRRHGDACVSDSECCNGAFCNHAAARCMVRITAEDLIAQRGRLRHVEVTHKYQ